jgi:UDP-N-acetylglucosamine:LPS N-acetylglucosamine transferase
MAKLNVLAVCSGGGHLEQLLCIKEAFGTDVALCTTVKLPNTLGFNAIYNVTDCNKDRIIDTLKCTIEVYKLVYALKPKVIISTGAAPGLLAILFGRLFGAKTIWIDSIANAEQLSLSGKMAGKIANVWLTQWPHLESKTGPKFWGNVL